MASYLWRMCNQMRSLVYDQSKQTSTRFSVMPNLQWISHVSLVEASFTNLFNNIQYPDRLAVGFNYIRNTRIINLFFKYNNWWYSFQCHVGASSAASLAAGGGLLGMIDSAVPVNGGPTWVPGSIQVGYVLNSYPSQPGVIQNSYPVYEISLTSSAPFSFARSGLFGFLNAQGDPQGIYGPTGAGGAGELQSTYSYADALQRDDGLFALYPEFPLAVFTLGPIKDQEVFNDYNAASADLTSGLSTLSAAYNIDSTATVNASISSTTRFLTISNTTTQASSFFAIFGRGYRTSRGQQLTTSYQYGFVSDLVTQYPATSGTPAVVSNPSMVSLQGPQEVYIEITLGQGGSRLQDSDGKTYKIACTVQNTAPRGFTSAYKVPDDKQQHIRLDTSGTNAPRSISKIDVRFLGGPKMDELVADESMCAELVFRVWTTETVEA